MVEVSHPHEVRRVAKRVKGKHILSITLAFNVNEPVQVEALVALLSSPKSLSFLYLNRIKIEGNFCCFLDFFPAAQA
jgi:hypothetical protein